MKSTLRILLLLASFPIAYFAGLYAESFTLAPLGNGHFEGTPLTMLAFFVVFPLTLIVVLVIGNVLITRYYRNKIKAIDFNSN
jgi:hypothetical protein